MRVIILHFPLIITVFLPIQHSVYCTLINLQYTADVQKNCLKCPLVTHFLCAFTLYSKATELKAVNET